MTVYLNRNNSNLKPITVKPTVAQRVLRRLRLLLDALRDQSEDWFPRVVVPRLTKPEFEARFRTKLTLREAFEAQFKDDIGLPADADREFLFSFLFNLQPKSFLEIGTWRGGTAAMVKMLCPRTEVYTINHPDPLNVSNPLPKKEIGRAFVSRKLDVKLVWADSSDLPRLNIPSFQVIFVDGDHSYEAALKDLANSWTKLEPGGFLFFHDFVQDDVIEHPHHTRTVVRAYRTFASRYKPQIADAFQVENTWIGVVRRREQRNNASSAHR